MTQRNPQPPTPPRVVLFCTATVAQDIPTGEDQPASLLPLGAGSFLTQVLGQLADLGLRQVTIVLSDQPEAIRKVVDDGAFWGMSVQWVLAKSAAHPYSILRHIEARDEGRTLVGHADHWISAALLRTLAQRKAGVSVARTEAAWVGWASMADGELEKLPPDADFVCLGRALELLPGATQLAASEVNHATPSSATALLNAQRLSFEGASGPSIPSHWIRMPWGAMSPDARVHSGAQLQGPLLIGPRCVINDGACVGPNVVLASDVLVSAGTDIRHAVIMEGTFLGAQLDLHDVVVAGNRLQSSRLGIGLVISDQEGTLLPLQGPSRTSPGLFGRLVAAGMVVTATLPTVIDWAIRTMRHRPGRWVTREVVVGRNPRNDMLRIGKLRCPRYAQGRWGRLVAHYGTLLDIVAGRQCWFGVRPRTLPEWYSLNRDWQTIFLTAPIGMLHAPAWQDEDIMSQDAPAAADAYFATRAPGWPRIQASMSILRHAACPRAGT